MRIVGMERLHESYNFCGEKCPDRVQHQGRNEGTATLCKHGEGLDVRPVIEMLKEWRQKFLDLKWMHSRYGLVGEEYWELYENRMRVRTFLSQLQYL